jgi:5'(3')-deoxyribonucleotidase
MDLDGCVVDLHDPLLDVHGLKMEDWKLGEFWFEQAFGVSTEVMWGHPTVKHPDFWAELPKTPWADDLMALARSQGDVVFATAPLEDPNCFSGKKRWLDRHYPKVPFMIGTAKHFLAAPGRALIDDSDSGVAKFTKAGGRGILLPRIWNALHQFRHDPVGVVRRNLEEWPHPQG